MRILSLLLIIIAIFLATFFYLRSTQKTLKENIAPQLKSDTRIEHAKKSVEDFNKAAKERMKEAEKVISDE